jgi:hypothetical protein
MDGTVESRRELAIRRLKAKSGFKIHLLFYLAVNALLVATWALSDAGGYFWPIFPIVGWGIAVAINAYAAYWGDVYTEEQIQREMKNLP